MSSAVIPVWICRDLERFDFCVDMLNDHPSSRKAFVIRLFPFSQFVLLA
jgi:hypothetical protein